MSRKVVGPFACCLFLTWGVVAAPRKGEPSPDHYFPSQVGDKTVMALNDGEHDWGDVGRRRHHGSLTLRRNDHGWRCGGGGFRD